MEISKLHWGCIALRICGLIVWRTLLGALLGLCAGVIAGGICGGICAMDVLGLIFGGYFYGPWIGLVSAAISFAIQGLIMALGAPSRWREKWRLACRFLIPATLFSSVLGGFSIGLGNFLWFTLAQKQNSSNVFIEANNGFFYGSIFSYCVGTFVAVLAPQRVVKAQTAWRRWRAK